MATSNPKLLAFLSTQPNLSNLTSYLSINNLDVPAGGTLLAASNLAFSKVRSNSTVYALLNGDSLSKKALLNYHFLPNQSFQAPSPAFLRTNLVDDKYTNVTGGQVVFANSGQSNRPYFIGGFSQGANASSSQVLEYDGGRVIIIDDVLIPPTSFYTTALASKLTALIGDPSSDGVSGLVNRHRDVTVFAPSNSAFAALATSHSNVSAADIHNIALYHFVTGYVVRSDNFHNTTFKSLYGNLTMTVSSSGNTYINQARIISSDLLFANGVIHILDSVLNPYNSTLTPDYSSPTPLVAFPGATSASSPPSASHSSISTTNTSTTSNAPSDDVHNSTSGSPNTGTIVGAVVGSIVGILAIMAMILVYRRIQRRKRNARAISEEAPPQLSSAVPLARSSSSVSTLVSSDTGMVNEKTAIKGLGGS